VGSCAVGPLLPESLTVFEASAARNDYGGGCRDRSRRALDRAGFVLLYVLDQKSLLPEEGIDEVPEQTTGVTQAGWVASVLRHHTLDRPLRPLSAPSICLGSSAPAYCRLIRFI
jgi:hypothetical protein